MVLRKVSLKITVIACRPIRRMILSHLFLVAFSLLVLSVLGLGMYLTVFYAYQDRCRSECGSAQDEGPPHRVSKFARQYICQGLFAGNLKSVFRAKRYMRRYPMTPVHDNDYLRILSTQTCRQFKTRNGYFLKPTSTEEENFPLAYGILVYKDFEQVERLFRAIYMPQNVYCFHVDSKSSADFYNAVLKLTDCFENAFVVDYRVDVRWGEFSLLEAEVNCAGELIKHKRWKYYINLTGQEFPLKSNRQLVRIFKAYNGSNDIDVQNVIGTWNERWGFRWQNANVRTNIRKEPAPFKWVTRKGEIHVTASREFIEFATTDVRAQEYFYWLFGTQIPDESFYATLNFNSAICAPGSFSGRIQEKTPHYEARYKNWLLNQPAYMGRRNRPCRGQISHDICIPGVADVSQFMDPDNKKLFLNKLYHGFQHLTYDCLEDHLRNLTIESASADFQFDDSFYKNLIFVKKKRVCPK